MEDSASKRPVNDEYADSKSSKFRFKSESKPKSRSKRSREDFEEDISRRSKHHGSDRRHKSRHSYRNSKHRRKEMQPGRTVHDHTFRGGSGEYMDPDHIYRESIFDGLGEEEQARSSEDYLDPDTAFRESLFDALADDEGAAYWEGVYSQPIHNYPNMKEGPKGELEQMGDEEYAEYVRTKMWEKSHQHILEEREARERERKRQKKLREEIQEENVRLEEDREAFQRRVQESLKRGEERKKAKEVDAAWSQYSKKWEEVKNNSDFAKVVETRVRELIPWPVVSGKWKHISKEEIEYFLKNSSEWRDGAAAMLKVERVRWHPDKMQQRFGQHIDAETMKSVTAVFQVVDRLWNEYREKAR
ncbi:hypothetical protein K469DRAFT_704936 [Zopfia rhizophila CBS 207.26]|uniref:Uncharacterized protein n=1 Tax=Zopfia rhizophila CBS 207.26 TaxID=1314779 RepID=A0A6A6E9P2_9PEZI|nr:hypothetical protein K469DRAFT_704936 [Zopfia rhizophila CBS 207.26]